MDEPTPDQVVADAARMLDRVLERLDTEFRESLRRHVTKHSPEKLAAEIDVEGIVQETLLKASHNVHSFSPQGESSAYHWLAKIANNTLKDEVKKIRARKRGGGRKKIQLSDQDRSEFSAYVPLLNLLTQDSTTPSTTLSRAEAANRLHVLLGSLNARNCAMLILRRLHRWKVQRIATAFGVSEQAAHAALNRGLETLREKSTTDAPNS
jgi:RNA polymerase sigma factor (sigma-70 family)